jgi:hypothetical protein
MTQPRTQTETSQEKLHEFTDTPCGRALAACEKALERPLGLGEMSDFLLDNFMEIADSEEAHQIRDHVLIPERA